MIWRNCFRLFLTLKQIQKMSELSRRSFFKKAGLGGLVIAIPFSGLTELEAAAFRIDVCLHRYEGICTRSQTSPVR